MMLGYTSLTQPTGLGEITFEKMLGYISLTQPTRLGAIAPFMLIPHFSFFSVLPSK